MTTTEMAKIFFALCLAVLTGVLGFLCMQQKEEISHLRGKLYHVESKILKLQWVDKLLYQKAEASLNKNKLDEATDAINDLKVIFPDSAFMEKAEKLQKKIDTKSDAADALREKEAKRVAARNGREAARLAVALERPEKHTDAYTGIGLGSESNGYDWNQATYSEKKEMCKHFSSSMGKSASFYLNALNEFYSSSNFNALSTNIHKTAALVTVMGNN